MRISALAGAVAAITLLCGCASTVSPLYTKTDAVADPAIVGTWVSNDQNNQGTVRIEKAKDGSYQVTTHEKNSGDEATYEAHLVKLGGASFADLLLTDYQHAGQSIDLPAGAIALHEIIKYQVGGDDLSYSAIDDDALRKFAKQPGFPLQFRETKPGDTKPLGGDTIILSRTSDLRGYFAAHPADIFGDAKHLTRQH